MRVKKGDAVWVAAKKRPLLAEVHGAIATRRFVVEDTDGDQALLRADGARIVAATGWLVECEPGTTPEGW